jgi:hypothetical protein
MTPVASPYGDQGEQRREPLQRTGSPMPDARCPMPHAQLPTYRYSQTLSSESNCSVSTGLVM